MVTASLKQPAKNDDCLAGRLRMIEQELDIYKAPSSFLITFSIYLIMSTSGLYPISGMLENMHNCSLRTVFSVHLFGLMVIHPSGGLWQRHQNTLHSPPRFHAEDGTSIVDQVELCVSSSADELPLFLAGGEGVIHVFGYDRSIRRHNSSQGCVGMGYYKASSHPESVTYRPQQSPEASEGLCRSSRRRKSHLLLSFHPGA